MAPENSGRTERREGSGTEGAPQGLEKAWGMRRAPGQGTRRVRLGSRARSQPEPLEVASKGGQLSIPPWGRAGLFHGHMQGGLRHSPKRGCSELGGPQPPRLLAEPQSQPVRQPCGWQTAKRLGGGSERGGSQCLPALSLLCPVPHRLPPRAGKEGCLLSQVCH